MLLTGKKNNLSKFMRCVQREKCNQQSNKYDGHGCRQAVVIVLVVVDSNVSLANCRLFKQEPESTVDGYLQTHICRLHVGNNFFFGHRKKKGRMIAVRISLHFSQFKYIVQTIAGS